MRADRLLSILLLLQARGRLSARQLAGELEVSERTIYRDIDALSAAGVPVYGDAGRGGGFALLESYRTTLTGLSAEEAQALFMFSVPAALADLGMGDALRAALRKLAAALPAAQRDAEARMRQRFHLDATWWDQAPEAAPHLRTVHRAVCEDRWLDISYRTWAAGVVSRRVAAYGLVAKAGAWHLVYARNERVRVLRAAEILDARMAEETFARPEAFDLAAFWQSWCAQRREDDALYAVTLRVAPDFAAVLPHYLGEAAAAAAQAGPAGAGGWVTLTVPFRSLEAARERLLGCGRGVEVLAPLALRASLADVAAQVAALYAAAA